tara:strand:+ start:4441 stop:4860 length:420 start_codon:yes stop_codon:yes gene_type:complete
VYESDARSHLILDKLLVKTNREDIVTTASFFNRKESKFDDFCNTSRKNKEAAGGLNQNSLDETRKAKSQVNSPSFNNSHYSINSSSAFYGITKTKIFFSTDEISSEKLTEKHLGARCITKANIYKPNSTTKMPMTENYY